MRKRLPSLGALAVAIATLAAFAPCLRHGFVDFDDDLYLQLAARAFEGPDRLRFFFGFHDGVLIALHAIIKKAQRTPAEDLTLARNRLKEMQSWPKRTLT